MEINYDNIISQLDGSKNKNKNNDQNILKTDDIGNTIVGRFLPNFKDTDHHIFDYGHHGWVPKGSGPDTVQDFYLCLSTFGEKCPVCTRSIKLWKSNDPIQKQLSIPIRRRENHLANFYVISDAKHPENNGKIKILRFGKQIQSKLDMALKGDDKEIFGNKIWRLDEQGCNFRIKCDQNSDSTDKAWATYVNSSFLPPSKIEGMTKEKISEILNSVFDLVNMYKRLSADKLLIAMERTYFGNKSFTLESESVTATTIVKPTTIATSIIKEPVISEPEILSRVISEEKTKDKISEDMLDQMLNELQGTNS